MPSVIIRNLSDETHRALKVRAAQNGRSAEAEMRDILETTIRPGSRLRLGTELVETIRRIRITNEDVGALERTFDRTPAKPKRFK